MRRLPLLSIVTPTRGNFSDSWLTQLVALQGDVQFVLVYPPNTRPDRDRLQDDRFKIVISPYQGEILQRFVGLLNTDGTYILALDDDDLIHPQIAKLTQDYFQRFPESWVLRPRIEAVKIDDQDAIAKPWPELPEVTALSEVKSVSGATEPALYPLPIAPLQNPFDPLLLFNPFRKRHDQSGPHIENFNNKVWRNDIVQPVLQQLSRSMRVYGSITWMPSWSLDRVLGLLLQAHHFEPNKVTGHWLVGAGGQVRRVVASHISKGEQRFFSPGEALLVKIFPRYGYFWNVVCSEIWCDLRRFGSVTWKYKILKRSP